MASPPEAYTVAFRKAYQRDEMQGLPSPVRQTLANAFASIEAQEYAGAVASEAGLAPPIAVQNAFGGAYYAALGRGLSGEDAFAVAHARQVEFASKYHAAIQRGDSTDAALAQAHGLA